MIKAGEKLKEKRVEMGLSLAEVSKKTKIKASFLEHIEKGEYNKLPSFSYAQGFVRNYANFLGLNERELMAIFRREFDEDKTFRVLPKGFEKTEEFSIKKIKLDRTFYLIFFIFVVFLGYIAFNYRYAFIDPPLTISSPKEMTIVSSSSVKVLGKTDPNSTVYVNSELVSVDENGNFEKTLNVFPGKSIIDVKVINKFLRTREKKIEIEVK